MSEKILPGTKAAAERLHKECLNNRITRAGVYITFENLPGRQVLYDTGMDADPRERINIAKMVSPQSEKWWIDFIHRAVNFYDETRANFGSAVRIDAAYLCDCKGIEYKYQT